MFFTSLVQKPLLLESWALFAAISKLMWRVRLVCELFRTGGRKCHAAADSTRFNDNGRVIYLLVFVVKVVRSISI